MYDITIIGAGPAGISAAIYAKRANMNVLVIYKGESNVEKAVQIENYYGFPNGISGDELYKNGIEQAQNLGVEIYKEEITSIERTMEGTYVVKAPNNKFDTKCIILATGNKKIAPNIKGITEFEGKGISYCAICDSFFFKNKNVAVIGNGEFAKTEANILKNVTNNITILTNGQDINFEQEEFEVNTIKIKEISGQAKVEKVFFKDGTSISIDGIFIALGEAGANDFAKTLGIMTEKENILVDENMRTNVSGIYACGNITGGLQQVSKAVYEGTIAGLSAVKYIKSNNRRNENGK